MSPSAAALHAPSRAGSPARAPRPTAHRPATPGPTLRVVPAPVVRPPLAPYLLVTVGLAVAGLVALLLLNTLVAQDSFRLSALQKQNKALAEREQTLLHRLAARESPANLAKAAARLGLKERGPLGFLNVDGSVTGDGKQPAAKSKPQPGAGSSAKAPTKKKAPAAGKSQPAGKRQPVKPTTTAKRTTAPEPEKSTG